jgi:hypothetical protein
LAPPRTATYGRAGSSRSFDSASTSFCSRRPATAGVACSTNRAGSAATDAWARWTAPKASST